MTTPVSREMQESEVSVDALTNCIVLGGAPAVLARYIQPLREECARFRRDLADSTAQLELDNEECATLRARVAALEGERDAAVRDFLDAGFARRSEREQRLVGALRRIKTRAEDSSLAGVEYVLAQIIILANDAERTGG